VNPCAPGGTWNSREVTCSGGTTETGGRRWGRNVEDHAPVPLGGEEKVEKHPGGVRRLSAGSIGVREGRKGRSHGEAEAMATVLRR
jgi:hypothetical protein